MNWTALKICSSLLRTYLSKEGGSFGACGFCFGRCVYRGVLRGVGKPSHQDSEWGHGEVQEETGGYVKRDRLLMILKNEDTALNTLEEQELMERCMGQGDRGRAVG